MKKNLTVVVFIVFFVLISTSVFAEWNLVDSLSFIKTLTSGEQCYVTVQSNTNFLISIIPPNNLTDDAETAVSIAPNWLKTDLRDNFNRLDEDTQNLYANLIINATYPLIDEICFEVAHTAPQTLSSSMNTQVLIENVEYIYMMDNFFEYVEIVDYEGDDYYSTAVYQVEEEGIIQEIEMPREIYYWHIVHPKLHKEVPNYINPDTGAPADPPTGVFWRDFLMNQNDAGYPMLRTCLDTCQVLWKCQQNTVDNGAVGAVTQWIQDVMTFQSNPHHDQPVRIYRQHIGTCSVHSYLTSGAGRAALIPTVVDVMYSNDHKVNQFWDRRWVCWEPVNTWIDYPEVYDTWGGVSNVASSFIWRGDSFIWDITEQHTLVCTLNANVTDSNGNPVDGARIKIYSTPCVSWGCTAGWTDFNGQKQFILGDDRTYTAQVTSSIGNYPASGMETVITNSGAGIYYNWNVTLPGTMPSLDISSASPPANPTDDYRLVVEYELPKEILYGVNLDDNNEFSKSNTPGHIDFFICDENNFVEYMAGQSFEAFEINHNNPGNTSDFVLPSSDSWYAVFSNEEKINMTQELLVTMKLYQNMPSSIQEDEVKKIFSQLTLYSNYPNPFNPTTTISFSLNTENTEDTELVIYNVKGQKIKTFYLLPNGGLGTRCVVWNGTDENNQPVSSGIYFYQLVNEMNRSNVKKMLLLK
ncbi:MAG: T9SS type A sorting domain-containing protein [Candidatus Cloacimonadales bacterium]|nr:T9SS type A sorting domain-containing protein [Candidatus Cloacimonadales bacterium]